MKRIISLVAALIIAVTFSVLPAIAKDTAYKDEEYGFSVNLPDDYTVINRTNLSSNSKFIFFIKLITAVSLLFFE